MVHSSSPLAREGQWLSVVGGSAHFVVLEEVVGDGMLADAIWRCAPRELFDPSCSINHRKKTGDAASRREASRRGKRGRIAEKWRLDRCLVRRVVSRSQGVVRCPCIELVCLSQETVEDSFELDHEPS